MPEPHTPEYVTFDYAIKYILRDKANFGILEGLLTCILERKVTITELLESESNPERANDKLNRVDLLCTLEPPKRTDSPVLSARPRTETPPYKEPPEVVYIEFQFNRLLNYYHRIIFGASKLLVQSLSKGDAYEKVRKVYSISVLNFTMGEGLDYAYRGRTDFIGVHAQDRLQLPLNAQKLYGKREPGDIFPEYFLFRLKNLPDLMPKGHLEEWLYFMKNSKLPENHSAPGLTEAMARFDYFRLTESEQRLYDRYQEIDRDTMSLENTREYELQAAIEEKEAAIVEKEAALNAKSTAEQKTVLEQQRAEELQLALQVAQDLIRKLQGSPEG